MKNHFNITNAVINGEEQLAVNARELWTALQSKQEFSKWIKDRLADFEEGVDYRFDKIVKTGAAGVTGKQLYHEYTLTLDTAKHLAMLERNEIGKKIRQYFIEFEKEARKMIEDNIKCCKKACMENVPQATNVIESTIAVIETINQQILAGKDVDKEVLRYAWNIGKLIQQPLHKTVRAAMPDELGAWIWAYEPGEYTRSEVYADYCQSCENPMSARYFWPRFRKVRCCLDVRRANGRCVVIK
jgi:phage anti-repressor protein